MGNKRCHKEGQPDHNWALYDRPICGKCRRFYENKYLTHEIRSKADTVFDWIYDGNIVHSPVPSDCDNDENECQPDLEDLHESAFTNAFNIFKQALEATGFKDRISRTSSFSSLGPRSQRNFRYQTKKNLYHCINLLTDAEADVLWKGYRKDDDEDSIDEKSFDAVMTAINTALTDTDHYSTKRQILGIVAADFPIGVLHDRFPGISDYQIKTARKHAYSSDRGAPVNIQRELLERYNVQQVGHFLEFVLSPSITADIPFGKKTLKLTTGKTLEVVNTVRNTINTHIIQQYHSFYYETTNGDFKPLGDSSLYAILKECTASTRASMVGIDNYAANGSTAFDNLKKMLDELATFREPSVDESTDFDPETTDDFSATCRPSGFLLWDCPVEGCIQQYRRNYDLQCHLDKGKYIVKGVKTSLLDKAKSMFKNILENDAQRVPITLQNFKSVQNFNRMSTVVLPKG
ncbi:unnamed protein product [Rotaria sp. Silwood2]|nr:unnamed protein product [Rotaria sp. Silwood2]CAF4469130.1 unnamed protein product [Rotaria sp. Silwood2]CAF4501667.1 unnamed protein product [Rotaria sp. Silwood2]